jgi:hypothetical protein
VPPPPIGFNVGGSPPNTQPYPPQPTDYNQPCGQYSPYPPASGPYGGMLNHENILN